MCVWATYGPRSRLSLWAARGVRNELYGELIT